MIDERLFGPNRIVIQGDLLTLSEQSAWTDEEIGQLLAALSEVLEKEGRLFVISVAAGSVQVSPAGRRMIANWFTGHKVAAAAVVAHSAVGRALISLVVSAINLVGDKHFNVRFLATTELARTFIADERFRLYGVRD